MPLDIQTADVERYEFAVLQVFLNRHVGQKRRTYSPPDGIFDGAVTS